MTDKTLPNETLRLVANRIRRYSIITTTKAGSGHPSSSLSCADLMAALFFTQLRFDFNDPKRLDNDRFILSKGHAAPALYATWAAAGVVSLEDICTLRQTGSPFEGHPTPALPWVDLITGSLGQGLANGAGMALYLKRMIQSDARVFVLMGDGELAEGSIWEIASLAPFYELSNLIAIVDVNRLEQSTQTKHGWDISRYASMFSSFGWNTIEIDGHDIQACRDSLAKATLGSQHKPTVILAKTQKGHGVSLMANKEDWHGKAMNATQASLALSELGNDELPLPLPQVQKPTGKAKRPLHMEQQTPLKVIPPSFANTKEMATRRAFGESLKVLGDGHLDTIVFDGDVKNSTFTEIFEKAHPNRFFQAFIAEQAMVGMATGAGALGAKPWVSTFAAFLTRAFDQVRIAALSGVNLNICGTHAGVSIGEDGGSQMGLEDLAMFRALPNSVVVYPADPHATYSLMESLQKHEGVGYMRATRANTPVLYKKGDVFPIGGSKLLKHSRTDQCLLIGAGITVSESLKAYEILKAQGIHVSVLDAYSIKPIDDKGITQAAKHCKGLVVVVEDHYQEGGLGDAVLSALAEQSNVRVKKIAVSQIPHSGTKEDLLEIHGLSGQKIAEATKEFISKHGAHRE